MQLWVRVEQSGKIPLMWLPFAYPWNFWLSLREKLLSFGLPELKLVLLSEMSSHLVFHKFFESALHLVVPGNHKISQSWLKDLQFFLHRNPKHLFLFFHLNDLAFSWTCRIVPFQLVQGVKHESEILHRSCPVESPDQFLIFGRSYTQLDCEWNSWNRVELSGIFWIWFFFKTIFFDKKFETYLQTVMDCP